MANVALVLAAAVVLGGAPAFSQHTAPDGAVLGDISIPRPVLADGDPLPAGRYQLRLTGDWFRRLEAGGQQGMQWVEFVSDGRVTARALALVIPTREIDEISAWHPPDGATRVDVLQSGDFVRVWANRDGANYLIHLAAR